MLAFVAAGWMSVYVRFYRKTRLNRLPVLAAAWDLLVFLVTPPEAIFALLFSSGVLAGALRALLGLFKHVDMLVCVPVLFLTFAIFLRVCVRGI